MGQESSELALGRLSANFDGGRIEWDLNLPSASF